jgi:hypothetical protein
MIHSRNVAGYSGTFSQMIQEFANLRYDALAEFVDHLAVRLQSDASLDKGRGRLCLADALRKSAEQLTAAAACIQEVWRICEPHMSGVEALPNAENSQHRDPFS